MSNIVIVDKQMEQEFAYVDSIINAHTNSAIAKVNAEALQTYWEIGQFVSDCLHSSRWGEHAVDELAAYLKRVNPKRRGYGKRNLYNMVKFFETYSTLEFAETVEQLDLTEFVQSQTAQIEAHPIMQTSSAQIYEAEFSSKMDMYLEALDRDYKKPHENPSLGIILCPSADRAEVEYSINRSMSPTMVAEYNRVLIPREVAKQSLREYCEYLKGQF